MQSHSHQASLSTKSINLPVNQPHLGIKKSNPSDQTYIKTECAIRGHRSNGKIVNFYIRYYDLFQYIYALDLADDHQFERGEFQDQYSGKAERSKYNFIFSGNICKTLYRSSQ